ncbi:MAG: RNA polymerase sigma factor [Gemmatimonadota bacterium]|nr:RNA polymerase sigma factor [Gemmatimonadota bacterium]
MAGGRTEHDDAAVVQRVLQGEVEAFGMLVTRYRTMFGRFAVAQCGDADLAEDAMQEAFIRAYDGLATCAQPERFGAWFFRILRNQCHNHRTRRRAHVALDAVVTVAPTRTEDRAERGELRARIETALEHLSADQREAFVMHHVEGRSYAEMASLLGAREDRLRMRVHRARDAVRQELEDEHG